MTIKDNFCSELLKSIEMNTFVKLSLGHYKGGEPDLKNIYAKPVIIKREEKVSFTWRYKTRDIVKNYTFQEASTFLQGIIDVNGFRSAVLFTTEYDLSLDYNKSWKMDKKPPTNTVRPTLDHDKKKRRKIAPDGKKYLTELRITDAEGNVYKATQDKFKQINHYVELLSTMLKELQEKECLTIADMGSGKGYLTFALYDYINNVLGKKAIVTGVEYRKDLVELCNKIAQKSKFESLQFVQGVIEDYNTENLDVLIALHACDTATDDAIYKGVMNDASLIVVAPCCHKQIRREMERSKEEGVIDNLTKYGVFLERQAEMVTDGIRALILEYFGYSVKVLEFVSDTHTPKNVMIVGQKKGHQVDQEKILSEIKNTKDFFGIDVHYLEKKLGLDQSVLRVK